MRFPESRIHLCAMRSIVTIVTEPSPMSPRKPESRPAATGKASPLVIMMAMAFPTCMSRNTAGAFCITTTATAPLRMLPKKPESPLQDGPRARSGSTMTMMDALICSSAALWTSIKEQQALRRLDGHADYCIPRLYRADGQLALPQQRRWHFYRRQPIVRYREISRARPGE